MRASSMVGVVALMLVIAAIGGGTAFAEKPVVSAPTVAAKPDDRSKTDPKDGKDKPKAEKPDVDDAPKTGKSGKSPVIEPTPESPSPAQPAPVSPTPAQPAPQSAMPGQPKAAQPKPAQPKPAQPKPAQPKRVQAGAVWDERGAQPEASVAKPVSPPPRAAPPVAASDVRHVTTTPALAAKQNRAAARRPSGAAGAGPARTGSPRHGGAARDAPAVASGPAAATPRREPRLVSDGVAAGAASLLDRQQPPVLILGGPVEYNVAPLLLLAIVFAAGVGYLFGREVRRGRGLVARRPAPMQRGARRRPAARGRQRAHRPLRRRLLGTRPSRPPARRSASAPLFPLRGTSGRAVLVAFRATGGSRRR